METQLACIAIELLAGTLGVLALLVAIHRVLLEMRTELRLMNNKVVLPQWLPRQSELDAWQHKVRK